MSISNVLASVSVSLHCLPLIVGGTPTHKLNSRSAVGRWSAHDHLAHLARYQHVFIQERCRRILLEDDPSIERYRAEEDPEWPSWQARRTEEIVDDLRAGRVQLSSLLGSLSTPEWDRVSLHPVAGSLRLVDWVSFFLIHEGHHLYTAWVRSRE